MQGLRRGGVRRKPVEARHHAVKTVSHLDAERCTLAEQGRRVDGSLRCSLMARRRTRKGLRRSRTPTGRAGQSAPGLDAPGVHYLDEAHPVLN